MLVSIRCADPINRERHKGFRGRMLRWAKRGFYPNILPFDPATPQILPGLFSLALAGVGATFPPTRSERKPEAQFHALWLPRLTGLQLRAAIELLPPRFPIHYLNRTPTGTSSKNPAGTGFPPSSEAATIIPSDMMPRSFRGCRFATNHHLPAHQLLRHRPDHAS